MADSISCIQCGTQNSKYAPCCEACGQGLSKSVLQTATATELGTKEDFSGGVIRRKKAKDFLLEKKQFNCTVIDDAGKKQQVVFDAVGQEAVRAYFQKKGWQLVSAKTSEDENKNEIAAEKQSQREEKRPTIGFVLIVFFLSLAAFIAEFMIHLIAGSLWGFNSLAAVALVFFMFLTLFISIYYPICAIIASLTKSQKIGSRIFYGGVWMATVLILFFMMSTKNSSTPATSAAKAQAPKVVEKAEVSKPAPAEDDEPNYISVNGKVIPNPRKHQPS